MLKDSKRKRHYIMEQVEMRQKSAKRQTSRQRRQRIESEVDNFVQTMSNISCSRFSQHQRPSQTKSHITEQGSPHKSVARTEKISVANEMLPFSSAHKTNQISPSFKNINNKMAQQDALNYDSNKQPFHNQQQSSLEESPQKFQENFIKSQGDQNQKSPEAAIPITSQQIGDNNIGLITSKQSAANNDSNLNSNNNNSISNNNSSAIFFTSQFHEFISKDNKNVEQQPSANRDQVQGQLGQRQRQKQNQQENEPQPMTVVKQVHFDGLVDQQQQEGLTERMQNLKNSQQHNHPDNRDNQDQSHNIPDEQIKFPLNNTNANSLNKVPISPMNESIFKNKSSHSIADSNVSSLKYSLFESTVGANDAALSHKLKHQLVIDSAETDSMLYPVIQMQIMADKVVMSKFRNIKKGIQEFARIFEFSQKVHKRYMRDFFESFIVFKDVVLEEKKNQIKAENFLKQARQNKVASIFEHFKRQFVERVKEKTTMAERFHSKNQKQKIESIFRHLKISWYDKKVMQQIDLYYLSKLFSHLKKVTDQSKKTDRNKYLNFYFKNMRRRFFFHFMQGIENLRTEQIQRDNAEWHYVSGLLRKCFDGWKDRTSYKERYISLAMTTKNAFRETKDHKWMHIKTVDFKQIK